jgi:hypothetical protein
MALSRAITGSPHGTLEAPLPRAGLLHFLSLSIPVLPFFRRSMSPAFRLTIRAWVTWARGASDGGKLFRGFFF